MRINPLLAIDFYKADHISQYPKGTTEIYSNFTPRNNMNFGNNEPNIIFFGLQYFIKDFLINSFDENFFKLPFKDIEKSYKRIMDNCLGKDAIKINHIKNLHELGYLPLIIKALPEGSLVKANIPLITIRNTHPEFAWLTNYIESAMSAYLWKMTTSATTAFNFRKLLDKYASRDIVNFQAHDFSFRGMSGLEDAAMSGAAHLTSFYGTDSVPAIQLLEEYYYANCEEGIIGCSVPATEHSVMCAGGEELEFETIKRLITEIYPTGIVSIVCDTWNLWRVVSEYLPKLKEIIMNRKGTVVIRPDSGNPTEIIFGNEFSSFEEDENFRDKLLKKSISINEMIKVSDKGILQSLWDIFAGTETEEGYKTLDPHIRIIYGDGINLETAREILIELAHKRFSSENIIFGIGSYTYQYVTRDTLGFAMKSTRAIINGKRIDLFKDPITDSGIKKSRKGLLYVGKDKDTGKYFCKDGVSEEEEKLGCLDVKFLNGELKNEQTLSEIRYRIINN